MYTVLLLCLLSNIKNEFSGETEELEEGTSCKLSLIQSQGLQGLEMAEEIRL
jgi:hypothetical protein